LFQPRLELAVAFEYELQSLAHDMVEVIGAEKLGVALYGPSQGFLDPDVELAHNDLWFRWFQ
jgi:hypothetical protein